MRRSCLLWMVVAVCVAVTPFAWRKFRDMRLEAEFQEQIRLARAEGIPTTAAEFAATIKPASREENAAPFYRLLKERRPKGLLGHSDFLDLLFRPNPQIIQRAKGIVAANQETIKLLEEASSRPRCWFDRDWSEGFALLFPEFAHMKEASRLLWTRGSIAAAEGRVADAIQDAWRMHRVARHAGEEPVMIGRLVMIAIHVMALEALARWGFQSGNPRYAEELERMAKSLPPVDRKAEQSAELFAYLIAFEMERSSKGPRLLGVDEPDFLEKLKALRLNPALGKVQYVRAFRRLWAALDLPEGQRSPEFKSALNQIAAALEHFPMVSQLTAHLVPEELEMQSRAGEVARVVYLAAARALRDPASRRKPDLSGLVSPYDKSPVRYSYDGTRMTIEVRTGPSSSKVVSIPPLSATP
ncbi:MAG TPA: hypothetical protein VM328_08295 [Fimbriimonadaceae bacterium]|nr:hypothetical protein [Fimbriimonadaceae bacterium]